MNDNNVMGFQQKHFDAVEYHQTNRSRLDKIKERLKGNGGQFHKDKIDMDDDCIFLLAENQRLVEALEYFTNEDIYKIRENDDDPFDIKPEIVLIDGLRIANDALQAYKLLEKQD